MFLSYREKLERKPVNVHLPGKAPHFYLRLKKFRTLIQIRMAETILKGLKTVPKHNQDSQNLSANQVTLNVNSEDSTENVNIANNKIHSYQIKPLEIKLPQTQTSMRYMTNERFQGEEQFHSKNCLLKISPSPPLALVSIGPPITK